VDPSPACQIDHLGPLPVERPASVTELGGLIRRAVAENLALYPLGGQTLLHFGSPPERWGLGVDMRQLDQVIDYPARDMTITVQAGIPVARLQQLLAGENQRLPIDVPDPDRATLGGILAANVSGPRRLGFGTLRDYVLGISVVNDEGHEVKAGGRVVKNVAGYDMCKLYVGSLGTLGIITQATLKVRPLPEETALLSVGCAADAVAGLLEKIHASRTRPVCLDLLNGPAAETVYLRAGLPAPEAPWVVLVGFEDNREAVPWQVQQFTREVSGEGQLVARLGSCAKHLWRALAEALPGIGATLSFKANLLPHALPAFCARAAGLSEGVRLQAHAGNGIVWGYADTLTKPDAETMLKELRALAAAGQGRVVVVRCPAGWKDPRFVWDAPRGDVALMRAVKEKLDPRRLFNPGRFVDGI
jgi:glycolate dehydrogenase FAD-binding subunit